MFVIKVETMYSIVQLETKTKRKFHTIFYVTARVSHQRRKTAIVGTGIKVFQNGWSYGASLHVLMVRVPFCFTS